MWSCNLPPGHDGPCKPSKHMSLRLVLWMIFGRDFWKDSQMDNDTCDNCKATAEGIGWIARGYRKKELKNGRPDPGNLCGACAGSRDGKRIATEVR